MDQTPSSLLEQLRRPGDREAWHRFVCLFTPFLHDCAQRLAGQEADANDLLQDVFVVLCQKLPALTYDRNRSFRGWLRTVVLNKWRDLQRRRAQLSEAEAFPLEEIPAPDLIAPFEEAEFRRYLLQRALQLMREQFQPLTWQACWEHVVRGRPAQEVADELGITVNAVYLARGRVVARLRQEMRGLLD